MRKLIFAFWVVVFFPLTSFAEIWEFSCTEAVSLLKSAQDQVVRKHDQLQEAKFTLRHTPEVFDGCRKSRRGFQGGKIHCVSHQSKRGQFLKEILVAQRSLEVSVQNFNEKLQGVARSCPVSTP